MEGRERGRDEGAAIVRIDLERTCAATKTTRAAIAAAVREYDPCCRSAEAPRESKGSHGAPERLLLVIQRPQRHGALDDDGRPLPRSRPPAPIPAG